jgi:hypothetical protein
VLLHDICGLLAEQGDDAVLIGGWVPDVHFPSAQPAHIGSIDVDMAVRLRLAAHEAVVALLLQNGFRTGQHRYQFVKDVRLGDGRTIPARLDLLTSVRHHAEFLAGSPVAPEPVHGTDIAFRNNSVMPVGAAGEVQIRVAGIIAFLVMKSIALTDRYRPKDAYDIHFCLENYPEGVEGLVREFAPLRDDELVREGLQKMAAKFRSEEDDGPRMVADVEGLFGEYRNIRKLAVYTRVHEYLTALVVTP